MRKLRPGLHVELAEGLSQVILDGALGDGQLIGDLSVRASLRGEARDLLLALQRDWGRQETVPQVVEIVLNERLLKG